MSRIITAEVVRARLSLPDDAGINASIESALDGALARVESLLPTGIAEGTASDVFFVDPNMNIAVNGLYTLRLHNGFVKGSVTCTVADTLADVQSGGFSRADVLLLAEKGHLKVPVDFADKYVKVEYTYGFDVVDDAPAWLREVVLTLTVLTLASQQISDGKSELAELVPSMERHWSGIMDTKSRYSSFAFSPLN